MSSFPLRSAAALSGALLLTGATVTTAAAAGEETANAAYTCLNGLLNNVPVSFAVDAPPATMVAGQKAQLGATSTVTLGPFATNYLEGADWATFDGTVTSDNGTPFTMNVPTTAGDNNDGDSTPGNGNDSTLVSTTGTAVLHPKAAGTLTLAAGDFTAALNGYDSSGAPVGSQPVSCVAPTDGTTTLKDSGGNPATVTVSKDVSTTTASATYKSAAHEVHGKAKIGSTYGLKGVGDKVKFVLSKKGTVIAHKGGTVSKKGVAKVVFKNIKKGHYALLAKFPGDSGLKKSSDTVKFTAS